MHTGSPCGRVPVTRPTTQPRYDKHQHGERLQDQTSTTENVTFTQMFFDDVMLVGVKLPVQKPQQDFLRGREHMKPRMRKNKRRRFDWKQASD